MKGSDYEQQIAKLSFQIDSSESDKAFVSLDRLVSVSRAVVDQSKAVASETGKASQPIKQVGETSKKTASEFDKVTKSTDDAAKKIKTVGNETPKVSDALTKVSDAFEKTNKSADKTSKTFSKTSEEIKKSEQENKKSADALISVSNSYSVVNSKLSEFIYKTDKAAESAEKLNSKLPKLRQDTTKINVAGTDSVSSFLSGKSSFQYSQFPAASGISGSIKQSDSALGSFAPGFLNQLGSVEPKLKNVSDHLGNARNNIKLAQNEASLLNSIFDKMGQSIKDGAIEIGKLAVPVAGGAAAASFVSDSVSTGREYEKQLALVSNLVDTKEQVKFVADESDRLSKTLGTLPVDNVKAFGEVLSKGFSDTADAQAVVIQGIKVAAGSGSDFNITVSGITAALKSYGMEANRAGEVADAFFVAQKEGAANIETLALNIGDVGAIASQAGVGLDELLASVSAITNTGITTSVAVTNVRQAIVSILKPTKEAQEEAKRLGLSFDASALKSKGFGKFIADLKEKTGGSSKSLSILFGSVEALAGIQALTGSAFKDFNKGLDAMVEKAGATEKAYANVSKTFDKSTNQMVANFSLLKKESGTDLMKALQPIIDFANTNFDKIIEGIKTTAKVSAILAGAFYAKAIAVGVYTGAMVLATKAVGAYQAQQAIALSSMRSMQTLAPIVGGALASLWAGIEIGTYLRNNFEEVEKFGIVLTSKMHVITVELAGWFEKAGAKIEHYLKKPFDVLPGFAIGKLQEVANVTSAILAGVGKVTGSDAFTGAADLISGTMSNASNAVLPELNSTLEQIDRKVKENAKAIEKNYEDAFKEVGDRYARLANKGSVNKPAPGKDAATIAAEEETARKKAEQEEKDRIAKEAAAKAAEVARKNAAKAAEELNREFEQTRESLKGQIQSTGELSEVEKMRYKFANSNLQKLTDVQKKELINYAEAVDAIEKLQKAKQAEAEADAAFAQIRGRLDRKGEIERQYKLEREIILKNEKQTAKERNELLEALENEKNANMLEFSNDYWERWLSAAEKNLTNFDELAAGVIENFSSNFGSAFESMIFDAQELDDAIAGLAEGMLRSVVNAIGQMIAQWLAYKAVQALATKGAQAGAVASMTANANAMAIMGGINAFASTAAIPVAGPALAPAAMASALGVLVPMATLVGTVATSGLAGMAHDGIMNVPKEGTWLLDKGERVTSANTTKKLDLTLDQIMTGNAKGGKNLTQVFNIKTPDADSFRKSQRQILKDARRSLQ